MSRRPMLITSSRTGETACCSGIRATGRASATVTTASKPETRITPLSTSTERKPQSLSLQFTQAQGCTYGAGPGGWGCPGGGSESLWDAEQKTVGPSRVKIRKIARAPVIWDPTVYKNMKPYSGSDNSESLNLCGFSYIRRHLLLSSAPCAISLQNNMKNGGFSRKT